MFLLASLPLAAQTGDQAVPPPAGSYGGKAREVMADIQRNFWLPDKGLYARSRDVRDPDFMWGNGVVFSALAGATRHDPGAYRETMARFFSALDGYWDRKCARPGYEASPTAGNGHDKYYDDNAWMVITFVEAYALTGQRSYLTRAQETMAFVLSGWDKTLDGGIWWHQEHKDGSKNTCANAPAAVGCLALARFAPPAERNQHLRWALRIVDWTTEYLQAPDGLYFDNIKAESRHINQAKLTYNSGLMVRACLGLHRASGDAKFLREADRIGRAADALLRREAGVYRDPPKWSHLMVEADLALHRATGDARYLERAKRNADAYYDRWTRRPPDDLLDLASIARTLWLMADTETAAGRAFWEKMDGPVRQGAGPMVPRLPMPSP